MELANRGIRADRDNVRSMAKAKKARLEERIGKLKKENVELLEWVSDVEGDNAKLLERTSTSSTSELLALL